MLGFMALSGAFNVDEMVLLNRCVFEEKDDFLSHCAFSKAVTNDADIVALWDGLEQKVRSLSGDEWNELLSFLPFSVPFSDADLDEAVASDGE